MQVDQFHAPTDMPNLYKTVISKWDFIVVAILTLMLHSSRLVAEGTTTEPTKENSIEQDLSNESSYQHVACGTIASNLTNILVKNPHHPEPTYVKAICETVVERSNPSIKKLSIKFKQFELYRPNFDGTCLHDRFGVYNDLNVAVTPIICGNYTGKSLSVPFISPHTSLIVSITTSDLDHDRFWVLEIEQDE